MVHAMFFGRLGIAINLAVSVTSFLSFAYQANATVDAATAGGMAGHAAIALLSMAGAMLGVHNASDILRDLRSEK